MLAEKLVKPLEGSRLPASLLCGSWPWRFLGFSISTHLHWGPWLSLQSWLSLRVTLQVAWEKFLKCTSGFYCFSSVLKRKRSKGVVNNDPESSPDEQQRLWTLLLLHIFLSDIKFGGSRNGHSPKTIEPRGCLREYSTLPPVPFLKNLTAFA